MNVERGERGVVFYLPKEKYWLTFLKHRFDYQAYKLDSQPHKRENNSVLKYEVHILRELLWKRTVRTWEASQLHSMKARFSLSNFDEACSTVETYITNFDFLKQKILEQEREARQIEYSES